MRERAMRSDPVVVQPDRHTAPTWWCSYGTTGASSRHWGSDGGIGARCNASCCSCTLDVKCPRVLGLSAADETVPKANIVRSMLSK
jgi:hypothetical protein